MCNLTLNIQNTSLVVTSGNSVNASYAFSEKELLVFNVTRQIKDVIIPSVFLLGIVGNTVNLVVLSQKNLKRNMEYIEKSATIGLMSLALSDLLFCSVGFPALFLGGGGSGTDTIDVITFYYTIYKRPLLNIFLFSSTWLITVISGERFIGVCFPYRACSLIKVRRTIIAHSIVFAIAIFINLPLFFEFRIEQVDCYVNCSCYTMLPSWFSEQRTLAKIHQILWLTLGTFIPLFILLFCNASILKAINQRRHVPAGHHHEDQQAMMRLTWLLILIVFLFLILVCPSMVVQMIEQAHIHHNHLALAVTITNLFQALKFSSNFLLYCGLHTKFRKIITCKMPTRVLSRLQSNEFLSRNREHNV